MRNVRTNSEPIVYHAPGKTRRLQLWGELCRTKFESEAVEVPSYDVITWSTDHQKSVVEKSCESLGASITVLKKDQESWSNIDKVFMTIDFARQSTAEYIIGLDAFDVVLTEHPSHIVERFADFNCELLFNASNGTWPKRCKPLIECDRFEAKFKTKYQHLNAGCWIGKREYVIEFFEKVAKVEREIIFSTRYRGTEQTSVKLAAFPSEYPRVDIDKECVIFQHMRGYKDLIHNDGIYPA